MVVFTCNHCGDSLQKPRVAKHYEFGCRKPISLTCIDCLKDFNLEEYVKHTKCVTENERYSAKGTVKDVHKGEEKQNAWAEAIQTVIEKIKNDKPHLRNFVDKIANNVQNIPRKKAKFVNFLSNSVGKRNPKEIDEFWDLLQAHMPAPKPQNNDTKNNQNNDKSKSDNKRKSDENESNEQPKKKKKKSKNSDVANNENGDTEKQTNKAETNEDGSDKKKNKKKKNKSVSESEENKTEEVKTNGENMSQNGNDRSSKKQKRKLSESNAEEIIQNGNNKKPKKKNAKHIKAEEPAETSQLNGSAATSAETTSKKKKKGKNKSAAETNGTLETVDGSSNKNIGFAWKETIKEVLQKHPDGLHKDKLEKNVLKKFQKSQTEVRDEDRVKKTYAKKLRKMSDVNIENDLIKLAV